MRLWSETRYAGRCAIARRFAARFVIVAYACFAPPAAFADKPLPVDVELVLAVDASFSVGGRESDIQRIGYVAAFNDPEVQGALTGGFHGRSAVTFVEWADSGFQRVVVGWTLIDSAAAAEDFAARLAAAPKKRSGSTSLSNALIYSAQLFAANPFAGERLVIDISADGANNDGPPVESARDAVAALGITINALPLLTGDADGSPVDLADYFRGCVIAGPGAFSHPVETLEDIGAGIRRKMVMELSGLPIHRAGWRADAPPARLANGDKGSSPDCLIGERLRREEYMRQLDDITGGRSERWRPSEETWPTPEE